MIACSKSRSLTSSLFTKWADSLHDKHLINEIDQIDRDEVLTQLSLSKEDQDEIRDIGKFEKQEKSLRSFARNIDKKLIDINADPEVEIPDQISPKSKMNLETIFKNLGSILQNSMEKHCLKDSNYEETQKQKVWKEQDINSK